MVPWTHPSPYPKQHLDWISPFALFTTVTNGQTDHATPM